MLPAQTYLFIVALVGLIAAFNIGYLLLLLCAAQAASLRNRRQASRTAWTGNHSLPQLLVVVPAHNEELVLAATLSSLNAQDYPKHLYEVAVVADNCSDTTAAIARAHGAIVLERFNQAQRGKGYALEWAFARLLSSSDDIAKNHGVPVEAFVIVDADTWAATDFLSVVGRRLQHDCPDGYDCPVALQGRYGVLNKDESWRAALMAGAFDLFNHIKPLGQDYLGLSVGLKGNGMAFTRPVLTMAPWQGHSITEDIDFGLDLLYHHGIRVGYVPQAVVQAQMPTTADQAKSQRNRWEGGRYRLVRERAFPLLSGAVRRRDLRLLDAVCALAALPLSEIATVLVGFAALVGIGAYLGWLPKPAFWGVGSAVLVAGFVMYILGGFRLAGASPTVYASLLKAPFYAVWKLALYGANLVQGGKRRTVSKADAAPEWVRTERAALSFSSSTEKDTVDMPCSDEVSQTK